MKINLEKAEPYHVSTWEACQELAQEQDLIAFNSQNDELFIDLDNGVKLNQRVLDALQSEIESQLQTTSVSKTGTHSYIRLRRSLPLSNRVFLQACLGSDPVRELLNRTLKLDFQCLFETPEEAQHVIAWRTSFTLSEEVPF